MRGTRRNRVFLLALGLSALLHLSTFTLFNVVIYFPREDIAYADFEIVEVAAEPSAQQPASTGRSLAPGERVLRLGQRNAGALASPRIELPTLQFAELRRLRLQEEQLTGGEDLLDRVLARAPDDSWSRLGAGLRRITESLPTLRLDGPGETASNAAREPIRLRPAPDFTGEVTWNTPPYERALLFSPPMEALYDVEPAAFSPLAIVFEVNQDGRVVSVYAGQIERAAVLDSVQSTLLRYRFEPAPNATLPRQRGTLRIEAGRL